MVDAQKESVGRVPLGLALVGRKLEDLECVSVGVLEVEGAEAGGILVLIRQPLRTGGDVLNMVLSQHLIGAIDIADDDGNVLEPAIVAAASRPERVFPWASSIRSIQSTHPPAAS